MLTAWSLIAVLLAGLVAYLRPVQRPPLVPLRHEDKQDAPQRRSRRCLLVTAHPDDECMFFSPAILHLRRLGVEVVILCLSRGNFDGLGETREKELLKSASVLGVPETSVRVLDDPYVLSSLLQTGPYGL
jgi:N-acetylglucosaminylphosphatidylinositol deacetylase